MRPRRAFALILSGVFPGLGQVYKREWTKGLVFVISGLALSWLATRGLGDAVEAWVSSGGDAHLLWGGFDSTALASGVLLLVLWLWSVIDAWRS